MAGFHRTGWIGPQVSPVEAAIKTRSTEHQRWIENAWARHSLHQVTTLPHRTCPKQADGRRIVSALNGVIPSNQLDRTAGLPSRGGDQSP
jgi:hypothetical protein